MKQLLWLHRDTFDTILDSLTWIEMANAFSDIGVQTTILCGYRNKPIQVNCKAKIIWVSRIQAGGLFLLPSLIKFWFYTQKELITKKVDFVILDIPTFFCAFPYDILSKLGFIKTRIIIDLRTFEYGANNQPESFRERFWYFYTRIALVYGNVFHYGVSVITRLLAEKIIEYHSNTNITVWTSGYTVYENQETASFRPTDLDKSSKKCLKIIYHGSLSQNRGLFEAIKGVKLVRDLGENILFTIIGEGLIRKQLENYIKGIDAEDCCKIYPALPHKEIFTILNKNDIGIMTYPAYEYWNYNFPIKLAEYFSLGKPVLCTDIPMFRNSVMDEGSFYYVEDNNPILIAEKLVEILKNPADLIVKSGIAKHEAISLTWEKQAKHLLEFIEKSH